MKKEELFKIINYWVPPVLWALLIFRLSSGKLPEVTDSYWGDFAVKKTSHVIFFGFFAILNYRALISEKVNKKKAFYYSVLIAFLYGITDEIHQSFVPGRGPHIRDVIFDTIGAVISVFALTKFLERFPKCQKKFL